MPWIAIAATVDNIVIAAVDDVVLLEEVAEYDFDIIVKIYGVSDIEYSKLKDGNFSWQIKFNNLRSTYLEPINKSAYYQNLSRIYIKRLTQLSAARGRFEHAFNKHKVLLSQQYIIYDAKANEAKDILENPNSVYVSDGYVNDYAEEIGIDIKSAATLVLTKYISWHEHLRKLERLRLRHFKAIKTAISNEEFTFAEAALDKDFFINMLL